MEIKEKIGFLFDLDGVLIDSEGEYTRIWSEIDSIYPTGTENFAIKIKGQSLPEILGSNFPQELHKQIIDELNAREQKMHYEWLPGARELLEEIKAKGYGAVLVTSSNDMKMRHLREERPELEGYFRNIVTADKITRSKPDPEGYQLGAKMLGMLPAKCVVFEDSLQGVKAGQSAGSFVVGLTTTLDAETLAPHCNLLVKDLSEINLDDLVKKLIENS